jgi:dTDP-4-amino-4,6-dideoxygalactose transaminase
MGGSVGTASSGAPSGYGSLPSDQDASGRSFDNSEIELLTEAIASGTLFAPKGKMVKRLERDFASYLGVDFAIACSSGTAALHSALAACDFEPGDEVITTAITDMGALAPILYQGLIPVFADVHPENGLLTAETIEAALSERTRALVVTHLFGNPCEVDQIADLAAKNNLVLIEDCAQAYGATSNGRLVGSFGDIAFFSLQQGKHITAGEGGLVVTNRASLADRMRRFVNKAWDYDSPGSDHDFLALNYRMSELSGAVALAQLGRLEATVKHRVSVAQYFTQLLAQTTGVSPTKISAGGGHSYWRYPLLLDSPYSPAVLAALLRDEGIPSAPRYIQKPAFQCGIFANQKTFGSSRYPFTLARPEAIEYRTELYPGTFAFLDRVLVLPWNERFELQTAERLARAISNALTTLRTSS